jgi:hypothetical protein
LPWKGLNLKTIIMGKKRFRFGIEMVFLGTVVECIIHNSMRGGGVFLVPLMSVFIIETVA